MSSKHDMAELLLQWCDHKAAEHACRNWHYSKCMPVSKTVKIGVWEDGRFIGAVVFARGACRSLLTPYGLSQTDGCELARVALRSRKTPVTRIVKIAIAMLRKHFPQMRLIVSFADDRQGHVGKIYQAGNWIYAGKVHSTANYYFEGRWQHTRSMCGRFGSLRNDIFKQIPKRDGGYRYRYLYPLTEEMRQICEKFRQPRPSGETSSHPSPEGGSRFNSEAGAPLLQGVQCASSH